LAEISDVEILEDFLSRAVKKEKVSEKILENSVVRLQSLEGFQEGDQAQIGSSIFDLKADSSKHITKLQRVAEEAGLDLDLHDIYREVFLGEYGPDIEETEDLAGILKIQKSREKDAESFYRNMAESIGESDLEGVDAEAVADKFEEMVEEEREHVEKVEKLLDDPEINLDIL